MGENICVCKLFEIITFLEAKMLVVSCVRSFEHRG